MNTDKQKTHLQKFSKICLEVYRKVYRCIESLYSYYSIQLFIYNPNKNYGGCYDASTQSYNCLRIGVSMAYSWCIDTVQVIEVEATSMGIAAPSMPNFLLAPIKQFRLPCRFDCTTLSYRYSNFSDHSAVIIYIIIFRVHT